MIEELEIRGRFPAWGQLELGKLAKTQGKAGQFGSATDLFLSYWRLTHLNCVLLYWFGFWPGDGVDQSWNHRVVCVGAG